MAIIYRIFQQMGHYNNIIVISPKNHLRLMENRNFHPINYQVLIIKFI